MGPTQGVLRMPRFSQTLSCPTIALEYVPKSVQNMDKLWTHTVVVIWTQDGSV